MKSPACFFLLSFLFFSCTSGGSNTETEEKVSPPETTLVFEKLSPAAFKQAMEKSNAQLIDVRTMEEVAEGFITGASNLDFYADNFEQEIMNLNKDYPVLLYCRSGGRSGNAAELLQKAGFKEIYDLEGGYNAWKAEK